MIVIALTLCLAANMSQCQEVETKIQIKDTLPNMVKAACDTAVPQYLFKAAEQFKGWRVTSVYCGSPRVNASF